MAVLCSRRKYIRYLWSSLVVMTCFACAALVYISLLFGKNYHSEDKRGKAIFNRSGYEKQTDEKCLSVCSSEACVQTSNFLLNRVETNADPCKNFYRFACGKFTAKFWNESRHASTEMHTRMKVILKDLLENIEADPESATGKVKTVYNSCIKPNSSDLQAIPTLLKYLTRFGIPNWPNLDPSFKFVEPSFTDTLGNFLTYQEYGFVDIQGMYNAFVLRLERNVTEIKPSESTYEEKEKPIRKYLMESVLKYFNLDAVTVNEFWEESEAVLDAITHLKKEQHENESIPEEIYVDCVKHNESQWEPLCEILDSFVAAANVGEVSSKIFLVSKESTYFLQNIFPVLSNFSDRSIANYLAINLLFKHLDEMSFYFRLTFQKDPSTFHAPTGIRFKHMNKWQHCTEWLMENMFIPLGYVYLKESVTSSVMNEVEDLIKELIQKTADAISQQKLVTDAIRRDFENETRNVEYGISNLLLKTNESILNRVYYQFRPTEVSFLHNVFEYQRFLKSDEMLGILEEEHLSRIRGDIFITDAVGGSWFFRLKLGLIMPPEFRAGLERIINLVALGNTVAHEIGHAFHFALLTLAEKNQLAKEYINKISHCVENQYSQFKYEAIGKQVNGSKFIIENLADTAAIMVIDKIIERYISEEEAFSFPGFPYSLEQLLYISSLQLWCHAFTEREEEEYYKEGHHSIGYLRILGMIQNSRGFAKAFNCPEDSYMNPPNKCIFPE